MCGIRVKIQKFCFFFFQAEDGIRYLVRSRGLGDVYKRQGRGYVPAGENKPAEAEFGVIAIDSIFTPIKSVKSVSYTHLTLPTSDLV